MPSKTEILQHLSEVDRGWIGKERGATFQLSMSKVTPPVIPGKRCVELYLKGKVEGKKWLDRDFRKALGYPLATLSTVRGNPLFLFWDAAKALTSQSK